MEQETPTRATMCVGRACRGAQVSATYPLDPVTEVFDAASLDTSGKVLGAADE